jgi:hypothetical protein
MQPIQGDPPVTAPQLNSSFGLRGALHLLEELVVKDAVFHELFWGLFAGTLVIRILSVLQVRRAGERFAPDAQAIKQEGKLAFAVRAVTFFLLIGMLAAGYPPAYCTA